MVKTGFLTALALSIVIAPALSSPAAGQGSQQCAPRAVVVDILARKHGESPVAMGVTAAGNLVEIFASEGGGNLDGDNYQGGERHYLPHGGRAGLARRHARAGGGA